MLALDVDVVERIAKKYLEINALNSKREHSKLEPDRELVALEHKVRIAELKRKKAELEEPIELREEVSILRESLEELENKDGWRIGSQLGVG